MNINFIIDLFGVFFGIIFIYVSIRSSRSIIGSAFKKYHRWMTAGAICFTFGFLLDPDVTGFFGMNSTPSEGVHDLFLLFAVIIFVITNLYLPKEASEYMNIHKNDK